MVKLVPGARRGEPALPSSHARQVTLLASPSTSVTLHVTVADANVVSEWSALFGFVRSFTTGGWFLKLNNCRAGLGSRVPRSLIARTSNTAEVRPAGVSTVRTLSVCV